ncbi:MAG: type 2 isopentenyl-diphosphate Delta-isomerase [Chloroflexi bacterium HGW-Chloroflexi-3]|nr:MAG: type 2 isopentenyl-diphosphate Delta-isomerase [Chloroflexi bacterium HGW-Chloroflexi-3]
MDEELIESRKNDHIRINLEENVRSSLSNGLEQYRFIHNALPEIDFTEIDLTQKLFNKNISLPILISSMTGGTPEAFQINQILAQVAEKFGLAMGVGSQRAAIENHDLIETFNVRKFAPNILLFANLGAVQLNYGFGIGECKQAVEMINADSLILHLNPLQEAVQPEGDTNFSGLLKKIEIICRNLPVPVVIKEVGWGISDGLVKQLINVGAAAIDVSGAGGTSWSQVERFRSADTIGIKVAEAFLDWGIPTADALTRVRSSFHDIPIFASGGLKTGMDVTKSLALGANLAGMAGVFLKAAVVSPDNLEDTITIIEKIIRISMFATGSKDLKSFSTGKIFKIGEYL